MLALIKRLTLDASGYILTHGYSTLSTEDKAQICNGMGSETTWWNRVLKWVIPDHFFGLDMSECGNIHDYMYHIGGNLWDRKVADFVFMYNMCWRIHQAGTKHRTKRYFMATRYFLAVFWGGKSSFSIKE